MDSAVQAFILFIQGQRLIVDYVYVSGAALLIYDYLLILPLEINLVWSSPWTYTKILYLLTRYIPLGGKAFALHNQLFLGVHIETCRIFWHIMLWLYVLGVIFAECIISLRTWAIWRRDRNVGIGLLLLMLSNLIVQFIFMHLFVQSTEFIPQYPGFRGCAIASSNNIIWVNFVALSVVQFVVLVLMVVSGIREYRSGDINKISKIIHRDGILFNVCLLLLTTANAVFMPALLDLSNLFVGLEDVAYSVLTCRIVINIRDASQRHDVMVDGTTSTGAMTELHT
jgi:hypothetical protein